MEAALNRITLTENSSQEDYEELFSKPEGYIFKILGSDETILRRIDEYKPSDITFEVFPINPGTDQFTLVGPCHYMIVENSYCQTDNKE